MKDEDGPGPAPDPAGGANQARVRAYNERLVLSLVRRHEGQSKADVARRSGLTAQTVSMIIRSLEKDGLLRRGALRRGKVGQPSTPMHLNPDGAVAFGLEIGRRGAEVMLMDFAGGIRARRHAAYAWPEPAGVRTLAVEAIAGLTSLLSPEIRGRIAGLGVAMPFDLWSWEKTLGAPKGAMAGWRDLAFDEQLEADTGLPVTLRNDSTAACGAELGFGAGPMLGSFAYLYVGYFVGGGLALDHTLYIGRTGNAAAFGSILVPRSGGGSASLIEEASLFLLEDGPGRFEGRAFDAWLARAAPALATAAVSIAAVIDAPSVVIDGAMPPAARAALIAATQAALQNMDQSGIGPVRVIEGALGRDAPAKGAALLPLMERYLLDTSVLFK
ncbi:MAG: ROK family transcriptional regulator [Pseudomonadota bacterium]